MKAKPFTAEDPACPTNYPAFVYRQLSERGYSSEALLKHTGLTEEGLQDPNTRVVFSTLRRFILNVIETTGDPHIGARLALRFEANYIGPPAYAAINAPRLIDGLEVLGRFIHMTFPAIEFTFPVSGSGPVSGDAEICIRAKFPFDDIGYFVTASALLGLNNLLMGMLRVPRVASRCDVAMAEPDGWAEISDEISRVPVSFDASKTRLIFPAELLYRALPGADPINHKRIVALCEHFLAQSGAVTTPVCEVIAFLEGEINISASLPEAAATLGYSERGLRRQLERSGTSYRRLVEQQQERRARDLLTNTSLSIQVIAYQLGYETPSNFARGFKRWTGKSPKAYRDELRVSTNPVRK